VILPRVFSLAVSAELAVVKLVHRAAVTIEDSEETQESLIDGDTFGLIGKVRLHVDGTNFDSLLKKLEHVREYLAENLIQSLMQGVLHCAYYVFTRQRFDGDYDTLLAGGRVSGEDWRDYQAFVYHDLQALQVALCGQDKLTNMFSRCSLLGQGELATFAVLASSLTHHLTIASTNHYPKMAKTPGLRSSSSPKYLKQTNFHSSHWSPKSEALICNILSYTENLVKLEIVKVNNEILEAIAQSLKHLRHLAVELDNQKENERGLLALAGKKLDPCIFSHDEDIEGRLVETSNTSLGAWILVDEFMIRMGKVSCSLDKKMFNYQVSPLDIPPIGEIVERLSSLLDTGGGCHHLETVKIKGDTDIAFFKPLDCEPMVQYQKTYVGCSIAAMLLFLPKLRKIEVSYMSKIFHETLKQVKAYKEMWKSEVNTKTSLDIKMSGEMTLADMDCAFGAFPDCENLHCTDVFSPLFLNSQGNPHIHAWTTYISKISQFRNLRTLTINDTLSTKVFITLIEGLRETSQLEKLKLQVNLSRASDPEQKFTPEVALKLSENLPQLKSLYLVLSDFFDMENLPTTTFRNPVDQLQLSHKAVQRAKEQLSEFLDANSASQRPYKLEELNLTYSDLTENKFDFCLFGALLGNARQLKRLMFSTQFGFKDSWLVPILSAIDSWKNMEIVHLNTTQAFDSDYELLIDSDSELDESEKRPSEASLDFLTSWLVAAGARNLQFLRGDWKVSHRKYTEVQDRLAAGGVDIRLVVKVEDKEQEPAARILVPRPVKRYEPDFLQRFPYLLSAKSYRYETAPHQQDEAYLSTFIGQTGPFYESDSTWGSSLMD